MFRLDVLGAPMNLHSGIYGGMIYEVSRSSVNSIPRDTESLKPMSDLMTILSRMVDYHGKVLIPGVNELVPDPTPEEM